MPRLTDSAWALIVRAAAGSGVRGKTFRMSRSTLYAIADERRLITPPTSLYGVFIAVDTRMAFGVIELRSAR